MISAKWRRLISNWAGSAPWKLKMDCFSSPTAKLVGEGLKHTLSIVGAKTWDEVTTQYPTQALLAMAVGMTGPMVAWMVYRGMGWKNSYEMAAVMVLPVIPFLCLVWLGVTNSAQCGAYCLVTVAAMLGLMRYRRTEYSMKMAHR